MTLTPLELRLKKWESPVNRMLGALSVLGLVILLLHRSLEPFVLRYSLPYLLVILGYMLFVSVLAIWIRRQGVRAQLILLANIFFLGTLLVLVEAGGQVYARLHPAYSSLFLEPDPVLGWRHIPDTHWIKTDYYWYARQFSNRIDINEHGCRDKPRSLRKASGTRRVALLGDSLVEAVQVPLEKTAGGLLEKELNQKTGKPWEVLNFGTSNYGVGQFYLSWREQAVRFNPDAVFALVAGFHMHRTVMPFERSMISDDAPKTLSVRPTFEWTHHTLVAHPPRDYAAFVEAQKRLMEVEFSGQRTRRLPPKGIFLAGLKERLFLSNGPLMRLQSVWQKDKPVDRTLMRLWPDFDDTTLDLNLNILRQLGREVLALGIPFVLVDVHAYAHQWDYSYAADPKSMALPDTLRKLCQDEGFGYIRLSDALLGANRKGISTQWMGDGHFNEPGNALFADEMLGWILKQGSANTKLAGPPAP